MVAIYTSDGTTVREVVFARTLGTGQQLVVAVIAPACWVETTVDGQRVHCALGLIPLPVAQTVGGRLITHRAGPYGIAADEVELIPAAMERAVAAYDMTPDGKRAAEHAARLDERLAYDEAVARRERAWSREDEAGWAEGV